MVLVLDRMMDLPTELADVIDAHQPDRCQADRAVPPGEPGEAGIGEVEPVDQRSEHGARFRPGDDEHADLVGHLLQLHRAVFRQTARQVIPIVGLRRAGTDQIERFRAVAHDGEFRAHAAALGAGMGELDAARLLRQPVGDQPVEPGIGAAPGRLVLGEGRGFDEADIVADRLGLRLHVRPPIAAAERPLLLETGLVRRFRAEEIGALPAEALAEHGAARLQPIIGRRRAQRPRGGTLLVGIMQHEDVLVGLLVLLHRIGQGRVGAEAARIDRQRVDLGLARGDHLGQVIAGAARRGDAEGEALGEVEIAQAGRRAEQRVAVRRIGDRPVIDRLDAALGEARHAMEGLLDMPFEAVEIGRQEIGVEARRHAMHRPGRRALLVGAEDEAAALLAHVPARIGVTQHGMLGIARLAPFGDRRDLVGDDVLVLDRDGRDVEPDHGGGAARVIAGRAHHRAAGDVALVGPDPPLAGGQALDRLHLGLAVDGGAVLARRIGQQHGDVGRVDIAVGRVEEGADQPFDIDQRKAVLDIPRAPPFIGHADRVGGGGIGLELVHPVLRARHAQIADAAEADVAAPFLGQPRIEIDRVFVHLAGGVGHVEERQQPRRMPGRARCQLVALEQHRVGPARRRQMVEYRATDGTAADHHHARLCLHHDLLKPASLSRLLKPGRTISARPVNQ